MNIPVWLIVLALVALGGGYMWYATLISRRNKVEEALSSIDVQLRKRHDLLPNVLKLADQYMSHERELIARVTTLRNQAQQHYDPKKGEEVQKHLDAEGALQAGMRRIFAVAENYPDLKSSQSIAEAQRSFNEVEGHIAASRRFYNAAVNSLNNAIRIYPGSAIAEMAGVESMPFFEIEDEKVRQPVDVNAYLNVPGGAGQEGGPS